MDLKLLWTHYFIATGTDLLASDQKGATGKCKGNQYMMEDDYYAVEARCVSVL